MLGVVLAQGATRSVRAADSRHPHLIAMQAICWLASNCLEVYGAVRGWFFFALQNRHLLSRKKQAYAEQFEGHGKTRRNTQKKGFIALRKTFSLGDQMKSFKKILVASDLSKRTVPALARAALIARHHGAEVHVVHAVSQFSIKDLSESYRPYHIHMDDGDHWVDSARAQMHALAKTASNEFGVDVHEHTVVGSAVAEIGSLEKSLHADLVLVSGQEEGYLRSTLLRSMAGALAQRVAHPLLVTKTQELKDYEEVIVGIDFSTASHRALDSILQIAPGAHVSALHAVLVDHDGGPAHGPGQEPTEEERRQEALKACREELDEFLGDSQDARTIDRSCEVGNAGRLLLERAKAAHADLIVVGKSDAGPADAFFGSVAKRVISNSPCDVLVVP